MIRYLGQEEKEKSKELWRQAFPEESEAYTEFYYRQAVRDNQILAEEEGGRVISMLHRNPYRMQIRDTVWPVCYIVGVATRQDHRRRGLMRNLMVRCLQDLHKEEIPMAYLMPADRAYYTPFAFTDITYHDFYRGNPEDAGEYMTADSMAPEETAEYCNRILACWYEAYTLWDASYCVRRRQELKSEGGDMGFLCQAGKRRGVISYVPDGDGYEIQEILREPSFAARAPEEIFERKHTVPIMGRVTHGKRFMKLLRSDRDIELTIYLEDSLIPGNTGLYHLHVGRDACQAVRLPKEELISAESAGGECIWVSSQGLTSLLFGQTGLGRLMEEGHVRGGAAAAESLAHLRPVSGVCIMEII